MDPFVGQIIAVGFNFAPAGWVLCNGQLLPISEYEVLYTLLGTTYGGNGTTTFGIPDLRGRSPISIGTGTGLPAYVLGQSGGTENATLTVNQMPIHPHSASASTADATASVPASNVVLGAPTNAAVFTYGTVASTTPLAAASITATGGSQPHENRQPYNTVNYIMCYLGIYPSQS
jgi:microcystin-dependent protein